MIDVESTSKPEKSMPHARSSNAIDTVATSTRAANKPFIALLLLSFDLAILVSSYGNNLRVVAT